LQLARGAVKEELKRERIRLADVEAKEISARARAYLAAHPALVAEARPVIERWIMRGVFGKRAQRAQTQNPQNSMASTVQMSGAK